ncbi:MULTISPECIES: AAA family ATPase [unclassified Acinetobacter]|uniref:AAA family ATPase n=1 Tax=unclassified Acinetobacter TaxID=196816 RepID=UPI0015D1C1E2|nr:MULTISPECIES: AAA family ATPase [unclassified Acinetobacter]
MSYAKSINRLKIKGFKSLVDVDITLNSLNVLLGANGAGKSNLVSYFRLLGNIIDKKLQYYVSEQGGAERILSNGIKECDKLQSFVSFGLNGYYFDLRPTVDGGLVFKEEKTYFDGPYYGETYTSLGSGHKEALLKDEYEKSRPGSVISYCYESVKNWRVYHFHDTTDTAAVKRKCSLHDNKYLRPAADNLAAFLYDLKHNHQAEYQKIVKVIRLALPYFDDFVLEPEELATEEKQIRLLWRQKNSDYDLWPTQLSDGSLRFICLATALLQPSPPSTIIIDEPELGLHPYAIVLLGSLLKTASQRMQVIVSTQSVPLVDQFSIDNLIIVERDHEGTKFKKLSSEEFSNWLEDYSLGELWEKNILGGRPGAW